ncbi:MAG: YihY/virulence factor BrkB family protein, partial [Alcanivorax sp.]|nr:YihY/virulence factor BrkB family protein [Alcanivorax sp.]
GFLLLVSLLIGAAIAAIGKGWGGFFAGWEAVLQAIHFCISFAISTVLFAMIYKFMPRARIAWQDVWTGAAVTAFLFEIGKLLIGVYVGKTSVASGFGAAGSLVVLLVWVYFAAQIFLLGAEFTWAYAQERGLKADRSEQQSVPVSGLPGEAPTAASIPAPAPFVTPDDGRQRIPAGNPSS